MIMEALGVVEAFGVAAMVGAAYYVGKVAQQHHFENSEDSSEEREGEWCGGHHYTDWQPREITSANTKAITHSYDLDTDEVHITVKLKHDRKCEDCGKTQFTYKEVGSADTTDLDWVNADD